jgi:phosphoribosyl 1,2-cyclic phosphodiesterase/ActR/RegA family two-component response regulator
MKIALIIDDNTQFRNVMSEILRTAGWRVFEAGDGEHGLELARQHHPHVVLCDLLMPRGNGFQFCRALRADASLRQTRVVITSGRNFDADRTAAREAGADEYLTKPVQADTILKLITPLAETAEIDTAAAPARPPVSTSPTRVKFWGVRGSIATPGPDTVHYGGNTTCVEVRAGAEIIILDAGTGLRALGRSLMEEFQGRPLQLTLLLSHTHWDHIQGLPFFAPIYHPQCRLRILGFEGARKGLVHILSGQMESPYFPVPFGELPGSIEIEEVKDLNFRIGDVRVEAHFANHPGVCVGYRIFTDDGSLAFFPDSEPYSHREMFAAKPADAEAAREFVRDEEERLAAFLRDTDLLILDSQYDREEYLRHAGWGHGCVDDSVKLAVKAGVRRLVLFHHDPDHDDKKIAAMVATGRDVAAQAGAKLAVDAAREGEVFDLAQVAAGPR